MRILCQILDIDSDQELKTEEFYFIKLEALWILINLSTCETIEVNLILQIVAKVDKLVHESLNENSMSELGPGCDMKVLALVLQFYSNMVASGSDVIRVMLREARIKHLI